MSTPDTFEVLGIALALGLLVGMQRERVEAPLAGLRTFALITLFGAMCGLLAHSLGAWIIVGGFVSMSVIIVAGNLVFLKTAKPDAGVTTEVAMLLMFIVGAFLAMGPREVAVAVGGSTAVLLHAKGSLHGWVRKLADTDVRAIMQVALISLVILPVLPNEPFGPFQVLNLRQIWLMVVLVSAISFGGYLALKFLGERAGIVVSGVLGGMISSTATTVSYARRASTADHHVNASVLVIILASTVVYVRVLVEIGVVAPGQFWQIAPPILILLGVSMGGAAMAWWWTASRRAAPAQAETPTEFKAALVFAIMYAVVLLAAAASKHYFGDRGLFVVAVISGLTDMDAITLSTSRMAATGDVATSTAWRAIVLATIANLIFKAGIVATLGGRKLFVRIAVLFGISIIAGLVLMATWNFGET